MSLRDFYSSEEPFTSTTKHARTKNITNPFFGIPVSIVIGFVFWLFIIENRYCIVTSHGQAGIPDKCWNEALFVSLTGGRWPYDALNQPPYLELFLLIAVIFGIWFGTTRYLKNLVKR